MDQMVFIRTRAVAEGGIVRANLANTTLKRGSSDHKYKHSLSVCDNHLVAARVWVLNHMPLVNSQPIGVQSFDNGYVFAFSAN